MAISQPSPVDDIAEDEVELEKRIKEIVCHLLWRLGHLLIV